MDAIKIALENAEKARKGLKDLLALPADQRPETYASDLKTAREAVILCADEFEAYKAADLIDGHLKRVAPERPVNALDLASKSAKPSDVDYKAIADAMRTAIKGRSIEAPLNIKTLGKKAVTRTDSAIAPGYEELAPLEITPSRLIDFLPMIGSNASSVTYRAQTVLLDAAAARSEGNALGTASFTAKAVTLPFSLVGHVFDVTIEELEDDAAFRNLINIQAPQAVRTQLDVDVLTGSGTAPVMRGILNVSDNSLASGVQGIETQAKSSDSRALAIKKAISKARVEGKCIPNLISIHPNDWDEIIGDMLSGTTAALVNYQAGVDPRLWGRPVVENENHTEGTALVLDTAFWPVVMRSQLMLESTNADGVKFNELVETFRAYIRAVIKPLRPQTACTVTGL